METAVDLRGTRVLIVDDHETNRLLLATLLQSWGCRFGEAIDGRAALSMLREACRAGTPYRVALLDMQMPGMDGQALGSLIKADPDLHETVLIMLTSLGQLADIGKLREIGFADILSKPIRHHQLYECLGEVLGLQKKSAIARHGMLTARHSFCESRGNRARILVVDDNQTNQTVAVAILKKLGHRADAVANGREAILALKEIPYDLVFMDCQMPEMDGYEASRRIRKGESGQQNLAIPIIAMTANALKGDREKCLAAGMNEYIAKPVSPLAMAGILEGWLGGHGAVCTLPHEIVIESITPEAAPFHPATLAKAGGGKAIQVDSAEILNRGALLERLMGDDQMVALVIDGFLTDMPEQIAVLEAAIETGDVALAKQHAHRIKGEAANVGAMGLHRLAHVMEQAGRAGASEELRKLSPELAEQFDRLRRVIESSSLMEG